MEYNEWIDELFNREPINESDLDWSERFEEELYRMSSEQTLRLIAMTFERSGSDLARFSDVQASCGINLLTNECHDPLRAVYDIKVPLALRRRTIESFVPLYRDFFSQRCSNCPVNNSAKTLDIRCHMLWDAGSMSMYGFMVNGDPDGEELCEAMMAMFESILFLPHVACQKSALHGLGHSISICSWNKKRFPKSYAGKMIDMIKRFLKLKTLDPSIRQYAEQAKTGQLL